MLDFRTLPPSEIANLPGPETSSVFFTDPLHPPWPAETHYWDADLHCWLPKIMEAFRSPKPFTDPLKLAYSRDDPYPLTIKRPGSPANYVYAPERPPSFGDNPHAVFEYIRDNYGPEEVRKNYSAIKDSLLYPKPTVTGTVEITWSEGGPRHECELYRVEYAQLWRCMDSGCGMSITDEELRNRMRSESSLEVEKALSEIVKRKGGYLTVRSESAILESTTQPETEETDEVKTVLSREEAEAAYKQAAAALAEIERLEKRYSPDLPNGSVIAFRLTFPGSVTHFNYAAIRAAGQWFTSGKVHPQHAAGIGIDWSVLLACFEQFGATDFEVLRVGGEELATGNGDDVARRTVVVAPGTVLSSFPDDDEDDYEDPDDHAEDDDD